MCSHKCLHTSVWVCCRLILSFHATGIKDLLTYMPTATLPTWVSTELSAGTTATFFISLQTMPFLQVLACANNTELIQQGQIRKNTSHCWGQAASPIFLFLVPGRPNPLVLKTSSFEGCLHLWFPRTSAPCRGLTPPPSPQAWLSDHFLNDPGPPAERTQKRASGLGTAPFILLF